VATAEDLPGVWVHPERGRPGERAYDVLVFHEDGTGFLDFSGPPEPYCCETFRWFVVGPGRLRLVGERVKWLEADGQGQRERGSALDAQVPFSVRTESTEAGRRTRVLRLPPVPWTGARPGRVATRRYRHHPPRYATFRARRFRLAEEERDTVFRGKALSAYLAERLAARDAAVGEMFEVFLGACYSRVVRLGGQELWLAVNWDRDLQEWWVSVHPPQVGGEAEAEDLCRLVHEALADVDGLRNLEWHTQAEWHARHPRRATAGG
jgi:hypothetical protein